MFAFALWDQRAGRLILARDRLAKKPLFVAHHGDGTLSFASELGALLLDERIARDVDETALAEYLQYGYIPSPRTILRGVTKLEPGTMLTWEPSGRVQRRRYWQLDFGPKQVCPTPMRCRSSSSDRSWQCATASSPTCRWACSVRRGGLELHPGPDGGRRRAGRPELRDRFL